MNMEFKKKIQSRLFLGRISKTESWKLESIIMDTLWQYSRSLQNTDS